METAWKPSGELPSLSGVNSLALDTETTGRNLYESRPVGLSYRTPDGRKGYLPFGHAGGNLDENRVKDWCHNELWGKYIVGANIQFDARMLRNWGVDLEAQGCTLHEIQHSAALLDEYRYGNAFGLEKLAKEYLTEDRGKTGGLVKQDKSRMAELHSCEVGEYATEDANLTWDVHEAQQKQIIEQNLERVQAMEDRLIWVNIDIETNAARLDWDRLERWDGEIFEEIQRRYMADIAYLPERPIGFKLNASKKWGQLLSNLGMPEHEIDGAESYDAAYLKGLKNETVAKVLAVKKLCSLRSKYFTAYQQHRYLDRLLFSLHSLRGEDGTVSGRYSSTNVNVQQVFTPKKQAKSLGDPRWPIRELFIPDDGFDFFAADASQIEFRLFAHFSDDEELQGKYLEDPKTDFYTAVAALTEQTRDDAKITSLGKLYGMGIGKLAGWLGKNCNCGRGLDCVGSGPYGRCDIPNNDWKHEAGCPRLKQTHSPDCPAIQAMIIAETYDEKFPAAKRLAKKATKTALERGYVFDMLGQRHRFPKHLHGERGPHSALNRIIQGSAAKVFKLKLIQLYENQETVGIHKLRMPVHDEVTGDLSRDEKYRRLLDELLHEPVISTKVPLLWELGTGANWACAKK